MKSLLILLVLLLSASPALTGEEMVSGRTATGRAAAEKGTGPAARDETCRRQAGGDRASLALCLRDRERAMSKRQDAAIAALAERIGRLGDIGWLNRWQWRRAITKGHSFWNRYARWECQVTRLMNGPVRGNGNDAVMTGGRTTISISGEECRLRLLQRQMAIIGRRRAILDRRIAGEQPQMTMVDGLPDIAGWQESLARCKHEAAGDHYRQERCLVRSYAGLDRETAALTDRLLGMVGSHHAFGRRLIVDLSNAMIKSQSRWEKFIDWDCEWPGHMLARRTGADSAMTICRIRRTLDRIGTLRSRMNQLKKIIGK